MRHFQEGKTSNKRTAQASVRWGIPAVVWSAEGRNKQNTSKKACSHQKSPVSFSKIENMNSFDGFLVRDQKNRQAAK